MTVLLANAAMPARSPRLKNPLESFRKLTALTTPLHHPWRNSSSRNCLSGTRFQGSNQQRQELSARRSVVQGQQLGCCSTDAEYKVRRMRALSLFDDERQHYETNSQRLDRNSSPTELKSSSWLRSEKAETRRMTKRAPLENNYNYHNFSNAMKIGTNLVVRNENKAGVGNEDSSRGSIGLLGGVGTKVSLEEQKRAAFEEWAMKKFREAGTPALLAIEEMRQTFAPGSSSLFGPSQKNVDAGRNSVRHNQAVGRTDFRRSSIVGVRQSRALSEAGGEYRSSSKVLQRGSSSHPSGFRAGRSEQQLVGRSSARSESWSPKSTSTNRGRSSWNVTSSRGIQLAAEVEISEKSSGRGESSSASGSEASNPQPLLVKRRTKFPVNWNGRAGTVMLVDKPQGWTSFAVCAKLRYVLKIRKVGHAGTLDPMATGLLIVCLGKATKLADSYQAMTKVYSGTIRLGELTPSLDSFTEVSDVLPWEHITDEQLEQAKEEFIGDIFQTPPMYSAIKVDGERLYKKARRGEQIEIPPRLITIIDFQLERNAENRQEIHFKVTCSKGTYVRSLCADLAKAVGSYAHLTALRREKIGTYSVKDSWPILEFVEEYSQTSQKVATSAANNNLEFMGQA